MHLTSSVYFQKKILWEQTGQTKHVTRALVVNTEEMSSDKATNSSGKDSNCLCMQIAFTSLKTLAFARFFPNFKANVMFIIIPYGLWDHKCCFLLLVENTWKCLLNLQWSYSKMTSMRKDCTFVVSRLLLTVRNLFLCSHQKIISRNKYLPIRIYCSVSMLISSLKSDTILRW